MNDERRRHFGDFTRLSQELQRVTVRIPRLSPDRVAKKGGERTLHLFLLRRKKGGGGGVPCQLEEEKKNAKKAKGGFENHTGR